MPSNPARNEAKDPAKDPAKGAAKTAAPDIEALRKRHRELEHQKVTAQAHLQSATQQLDQLKTEAREQYGTDDLIELRKKLEEMKRENERKRVEYDRHLAQIETELRKIEEDGAPGPKS